MSRDDVDDSQPIADAAAGRYSHAQYGLRAGVVHPGPEDEARALIQAIDSPAGQATRNLLDVLLSIAAINAQSVKLKQLSRVIFVDSRLALSRRGRLGGSRLYLLGRDRRFCVLARSARFVIIDLLIGALLAASLLTGGLLAGSRLDGICLAGFDILILLTEHWRGNLHGLYTLRRTGCLRRAWSG